MGLSKDFHVSKDSAEAANAIWKGDDLHDLLSTLFLDFPLMVVGAIVAWKNLEWYPALLMMVAGALHLLLSVWMIPCAAKHQERYNNHFNTHYSTTEDALRNWRLVDCYDGHEHEARRFEDQLHHTQRFETRFFWSRVPTVVGQRLVMTLGRCLVTIFAMHRFRQNDMGHWELVRLMTSLDLFEKPFQSTTKLAKKVSQWRANSNFLGRFMQQMPTVNDVPDAPPLTAKEGGIEFRKVSFSHAGGSHALNSVSFHISPGSHLALVGDSGAGKSTLLDLLYRLGDPQNGCILIDGQDISKVQRKSLKQCIATVPQNPDFLRRSILDNLLYPGVKAPLESVQNACSKVGLHERINSMPDGYETQISESGRKFSGGELQRLAFARALVRVSMDERCKIVLFDEATSNLDLESQDDMMEVVKDMNANGVTTVFATHRLETTNHGGTILYLSGGKIVESGTHEDLLSRRSGRYRAQWEVARSGLVIDGLGQEERSGERSRE